MMPPPPPLDCRRGGGKDFERAVVGRDGTFHNMGTKGCLLESTVQTYLAKFMAAIAAAPSQSHTLSTPGHPASTRSRAQRGALVALIVARIGTRPRFNSPANRLRERGESVVKFAPQILAPGGFFWGAKQGKSGLRNRDFKSIIAN